jgi:hypothetical protein
MSKPSPEKKREYNRRWYRKNHKTALAGAQKYRDTHRERIRLLGRNQNKKLRLECLLAYGNKCACCGENRYEFLCIDHINGRGRAHRKDTGRYFYGWLKKNNFPGGFRVLCHNCNMSKGIYGYCPHEKSTEL